MSYTCPSKSIGCKRHGEVVRFGRYYRKSDRRFIQRFKCTHCGQHFSQSTGTLCYRQNKRHLNHKIYQLLVSGVSQRRISFLLNTHQITVARKLEFLALKLRHKNLLHRKRLKQISEVQFDDLETFEHTKLKPLSVTLMVEKGTRFILGFEVSRMPAKGLLAKRSIKKYGFRQDERPQGRDRLFRKVRGNIRGKILLESDENPHYPRDVKRYFPEALHITQPGQRGCITGQGELKKTAFDPLFSLNHTCAMFRANVNRLFRKTWCTTKKVQRLADHLELYVYFHNSQLI